MRLAYDRDGRAGPRRVVKLKPERDVKREANGSPQPQPKEQRWTCGPERIDQGGAPLGRVSPPQSSLVHRRHLETSLSRVLSGRTPQAITILSNSFAEYRGLHMSPGSGLARAAAAVFAIGA